MPLPLPDLDTRRWADLVDEGRALIPRLAPEWTDHNIHDPGITLLELFAWLAEQLIYRANRIPERHLRKFLQLAGFTPAPPRPACAVLAMQLAALAGSRTVRVGTPFVTAASDGRSIPFRAIAETTLVEAALVAAQSFDGERFIDRTRALRDGIAFAPLGADPRASVPYDADRAPACYFGFDQPLPPAALVTLWLHVEGARAGERERIDEEAAESRADCERPSPVCAGTTGNDGSGPSSATATAASLTHHSARIVWEYRDASGWHALDAAAGEIDDRTRALTLDGPVRVRVGGAMAAIAIGAVTTPRFWLRCRLLRGSYDERPMLAGVTFNAIPVEQARELWRRFVIAAGTVVGGAIMMGARAPLTLRIDDQGIVRELGLAPASAGAPPLLVLDYVAPTLAAPGAITLPLIALGTGTGLPEQDALLDDAPVARDAIDLHTLEDVSGAITWRAWSMRADLDASRETDAHAALAPSGDAIRFGDGVHGRVPADGAAIVASYQSTLGAAGNVPGGRAWTLGDDVVARALLGADFATIAAAAITSRFGASRGEDAEDVGHAAARAAAFLWAHERLVELCPNETCATLDQLDRGTVLSRPAPPRATTTLDIERIALDVPGTHVRRARAWAGLDPVDVCLDASGTITLVVVPALPRGRPRPSAGLLRAVRQWLGRRRVLCTRLVVVGPTYLDVAVRATVQALRSADAARVRADVAAALDTFLDPLVGGPAGRGWPFGRDVYRSEILQVIDAVSGVDHVLALSLSARAGDDAREATCDNLCVPPTWLVAPAPHVIDVVSAT